MIRGDSQAYLLETNNHNFNYYQDFEPGYKINTQRAEISKTDNPEADIPSTPKVDLVSVNTNPLEMDKVSNSPKDVESLSPPLEPRDTFEVLSPMAIGKLRARKSSYVEHAKEPEVFPGSRVTIDLSSFTAKSEESLTGQEWNNKNWDEAGNPNSLDDYDPTEPPVQTWDTNQTKETFLRNMDTIKALIIGSKDKPDTWIQLMNTLLSSIKKLKDFKAQTEIAQAFNEKNEMLRFIK